MSFAPDQSELLARARADLRMGVPIVLAGPVSLIVAAAETVTAARFAEMIALFPDTTLAITGRRASTLKAPAYDGDLARIALPGSATLEWVHGVADPAGDLMHPMKGPLSCARGGDATSHRVAVQLAKSARVLPAVLCAPTATPTEFAKTNGLVCLDVAKTQALLDDRSVLHPVVSARLPIAASEAGRLHVFRPEDGGDEHYAIEIGKPPRDTPVLTRLHSACLTGDIMGSLKCDCGPQLHAALARMGQEGRGVLLYLNQEGRGIGLTNKMRAYSLQDQGFDTVEANHRLGFEDDERDFRLGADILRTMGFRQARLLTNNPRKMQMLQTHGIDVTERVPLHVGENRHNSAYLATKVVKSGHLK